MPRYRSKKQFSPFNNNPEFESFMQTQIQESKNGLLYSNAIFLSELLQQTHPSKKNLVTLGELHYQRGNYDKVVGLLRKCDSDQGRYLLGMSLYKLKRLDEAEKALVMKYCVISEYPRKDTDDKKETEGDWLEEMVQGKVVEVKEKKPENEIENEGLRGLKENSEPTEEAGSRAVEVHRSISERHRKKSKKNTSIFR
jgi:tetratricopeptide (TPR) repeat protein